LLVVFISYASLFVLNRNELSFPKMSPGTATTTAKVMQLLMWLVAGLPPRGPGFQPRETHVGFVVDILAVGQVFSDY
jgi:hypothetical protein